jgi:hypothetical protein
VIFDVARIAELMWDVARAHESVACPWDDQLVANNDFQLSGK